MPRPLLLSLVALCCVPVLHADDDGPGAPFILRPGEAPVIQMLIPGFSVRELPIDIQNVNNLVCAPDGRLFALCYDGNVFQLKDSNADGLEDVATHFFNNERGEIPPSIGMAWGPGGLYISSRERIFRLRDRGDGTGDLETIAQGWVPAVTSGGKYKLDSYGIAVDAAGNVFFGLSCEEMRNAYGIDENAVGHYKTSGERGSIQKLTPDGKRENICSGLRYPVSLAINGAGDLFCTDQEGATWLSNGNPLDELLHIQPGRHYGFPPRHPKYLPDAIDEPSVFDYGPQHQATCGVHFNEPPTKDGKIFGPEWWRGDAFVCGEARGKLWRTKLVKTSVGYVARTELIACLKMLAVDAIPTAQGDLMVCCHSGKPDWGTGPTGRGKLFKISYTDPTAPQPVLAYAENDTQVRVIFDRTVAAAQIENGAQRSKVTMGRYVTAGERFESFRPGYQAVKDQQDTPHADLALESVELEKDGRAVVLRTSARAEALSYAVTLPESSRSERLLNESRKELPQKSAIDLLTELRGVNAEWRSADGGSTWSGWLPHLDLEVARGLTVGSDEHSRLFAMMQKPGTLTVRTQLNFWSMLHPAVQPGSKLDYEYPQEVVTVVLKSDGKIEGRGIGSAHRVSDGELRFTIEPKQNQWLPVEIVVAAASKLDVSWFTADDPRPRALAANRIFLPWAQPPAAAPITNRVRKTELLTGGDWHRGKTVFFSEQTHCAKCHQVRGEGRKLGPDLSNVTDRDYDSVLADITEPSAAINHDFIASEVELKDGAVQTGIVLEDTAEKLILGQLTGDTTIAKSQILSIKASSVSLMPPGLLQTLDARAQKDLLTFLLMPPPKEKPAAPAKPAAQ